MDPEELARQESITAQYFSDWTTLAAPYSSTVIINTARPQEVCMCSSVCACVFDLYVHICVCVYIYIHVYMYMYIYIYIYYSVCVCVCMCVQDYLIDCTTLAASCTPTVIINTERPQKVHVCERECVYYSVCV